MAMREFDFTGARARARGPMNVLITSLFSEQIRDPACCRVAWRDVARRHRSLWRPTFDGIVLHHDGRR